MFVVVFKKNKTFTVLGGGVGKHGEGIKHWGLDLSAKLYFFTKGPCMQMEKLLFYSRFEDALKQLLMTDFTRFSSCFSCIHLMLVLYSH